MTTCKRCPNANHRRGLCHKHYDAFLRPRPAGFVDADPVRQHLRRLIAAGMSHDAIAAAAGVSRRTTIARLIDTEDVTRVRAITAAKVLSVEVPEFVTPDAALTRWIDATGTARRLQALVAIGYEKREICEALDIASEATLYRIFSGDTTQVRIALARKADALFRQWQLLPRDNPRSINKARRRGWALPLAWDEDTIDDPLAEPDSTPESKADFAELVADRRAMDRTDDQIAAELGIKMSTFQKNLARDGLSQGRRYRDIEEHLDLTYNNTMSKRELKVA